MSRNISNLSGRIGLKENLFKKISENVLKGSPKDIKEIAKEYNLGVSTIHGAESFYEFLRPAHREKKAFVCNGSACMCAGTQEKLEKTLKAKLGDDKVGKMFCLGHCYENNAFHYEGENYAGKDIEKIDQIIKGEKITQDKFFAKSYATTSFLMDDKLSTISQVKDLLDKFLKTEKNLIIKSLSDSNLSGRGGAGFPTGLKWDACSKVPSNKKYVICNADEGDSGAFSDRYLLEDQPLKVLFGMMICGYVIGSDEGVLYIRGEYPKSIEALNGSINELKKAKLLGKEKIGEFVRRKRAAQKKAGRGKKGEVSGKGKKPVYVETGVQDLEESKKLTKRRKKRINPRTKLEREFKKEKEEEQKLLGDLNNNGSVTGADLGILLGDWDTDDEFSDLNGDGIVSGADLGILLGQWSQSLPESSIPVFVSVGNIVLKGTKEYFIAEGASSIFEMKFSKIKAKELLPCDVIINESGQIFEVDHIEKLNEKYFISLIDEVLATSSIIILLRFFLKVSMYSSISFLSLPFRISIITSFITL